MGCGFCESAVTNSVGTLLVDWVAKPVERQLLHCVKFHDNVEKLTETKALLTRARARLQHEIEQAESQLLRIEDDVRDSGSKADKILTDVESMEKEIEKNKSCFNWCPNWWWRYRLSKKLVKKTLPDISQLLEGIAKFGEPGRVGFRSNSTLPTIEFLSSKDFMVSKSSNTAFNQIMEALQDENVSVIGLWGMGGVGKTTLVHEVGTNAKKLNLFDTVVVATVSQKPSFERIPDEIAKFLPFEIRKEEGRRSAQELWLRLQKEKRILIILDDVWSEIDLKEEIGIPFGKDHKGCKILITTRRLQVCESMDCQMALPLRCLDDQEAWELFEMKAGLKNSSDDAIRKVAMEVIKKCEGLPIAIVTLGSALKGKTLARWKAACRRLKNRRLMDIEDIDQENRSKNAYLCLELSFDYLRDMETKKCFLLCSLYPEDYEIDVEELVRYAWGLEFHKDIDSIEEVRSEVLAAIDTLKESCLLLDCGERHVKMHDMVRGVALWIASSKKEVSFMIKSEMGSEKWPKNESFEPYMAVSLKVSENDVLPEGLACPNLKILLLKADFHRIPEALFGGMEALTVCSLQDGSLFPNAFQFQNNLRTLHLKRCKLDDISLLGKLKELQILSFQGDDISGLPDEIGELNHLKLLDLTGCVYLRRIPPNVIGRLSQLEELYLGGCRSIKWAIEKTGEKESNASLSELDLLSNLAVLVLEISSEHLPKGFVFPKLQRYDLCIVKDVMNVPMYGESEKSPSFSRSLKIEASALDACRLLVGDMECLDLKDLVGCQNLVPSSELDAGVVSKLSSLALTSCEDMNYLTDTTKQQAPTVAFSNLVKLSLSNMPGLEKLCHGQERQGFLQKLKTLSLRNCKEMISPVPMLQNLENLEIESCDKMQVIFQTDEQGPSHHVSYRSLKVVKIRSCNTITYLFPVSVAKSLGQLERLVIHDCSGLEEIIISKAEVSNICPQSLREVDVRRCNNLRSLSSLSHGHILENLRKLKIRSCPRLEYTFPISMAEALPQLNAVCLDDLPQLERRDGNDIVLTLPSLQELEVSKCPKLTPFLISAKIQELWLGGMAERKQLGNMIVPELTGRSPDMEYLRITNFEELFDQHEGGYNLSNMTVLWLTDLPELRVIWKSPSKL